MDIKEYNQDEDIIIMYVQAESFPDGITAAFEKLEQIPGGLTGRHVYGITLCMGDKLVYRAGVKENFNGEAEKYGLQTYAIPKGKYFYAELDNWRENLDQIPVLFEGFMDLPNIKKQTICLEDYISADKMLAMVQQA
jgi:hypothetical protein